MKNFSSWISAMRLRTLPLAISGIVLGVFLAAAEGYGNREITVLTIITAVLLQILSNFANDYGDFSKGTDNEHRIGPERALQSGNITPGQMKKAMYFTTLLTLTTGTSVLWLSFGKELFWWALLFLIIGIAAIWAAIKYTVGKRAYGYSGWGDIFVFIFFGVVSVAGAYFIQTHSFHWEVILPAGAIGFLSMGVLNLNNTRDIENDFHSGKHTIAVKLGFKVAKWYQAWLFILAVLCAVSWNLLYPGSQWKQMYWLAIIPLALVVIDVFRAASPNQLDPLLKRQALGTLAFAILFGLGQVL